MGRVKIVKTTADELFHENELRKEQRRDSDDNRKESEVKEFSENAFVRVYKATLTKLPLDKTVSRNCDEIFHQKGSQRIKGKKLRNSTKRYISSSGKEVPAKEHRICLQVV